MHDSSLCRLAYDKGFQVPEGRFFLGDAGFGGHPGIVIPYNNVRYHLPEWREGEVLPDTCEEYYNYKHAQLRNVVERIFGQLKRKWKIIRASAPEYSLKTQMRIVYAVTGLHNFIKYMEQPRDEDEEYVCDEAEEERIKERIRNNVRGSARDVRDRIAEKTWRSRR
jgi:hypothetical protein